MGNTRCFAIDEHLHWACCYGEITFSLGRADVIQPPSRDGLAERIAHGDEGFWKKIATAEPPGNTSTRQLFSYALALCESHQHPERLERLFQLAQRIQDRNPKSHGYGNIKWSWRTRA